MSRSSFKGISPSGRKYNSTMKTNVSVIKISKTMIAAALFMILTAVKLLLPGQTEAFRSGVREIVNRNYDYGQALETLGERISDGAFIQALGLRGRESGVREADSVPAASYQPVTVNDLRGELTGVLPRDAVHGDYTDKPDAEAENPEDSSGGEAAEETIPAEETVPEVVAAFLETQTEYADYEVPANVSYNIPDLPFAHASPVPSYTSSGFGFRWHPIHEAVKFHYGTDFAAYSGDDIYAFGDGVVSLERTGRGRPSTSSAIIASRRDMAIISSSITRTDGKRSMHIAAPSTCLRDSRWRWGIKSPLSGIRER